MLQSVEPFCSEQDIEAGSRWNDTIAAQLEEMSFGVVCVTEENAERPWINFEAGALTKVRSVGRVVPLLIGVEPSQVTGPLTQFQMCTSDEEGIRKLVQDVNNATQSPLPEARFNEQFRKWWPDLDDKIQKALTSQTDPAAKETRSESDMLAEVLEIVRDQQRRLSAESPPAKYLSVREQRVLIESISMLELLRSSGVQRGMAYERLMELEVLLRGFRRSFVFLPETAQGSIVSGSEVREIYAAIESIPNDDDVPF